MEKAKGGGTGANQYRAAGPTAQPLAAWLLGAFAAFNFAH